MDEMLNDGPALPREYARRHSEEVFAALVSCRVTVLHKP